jgi:putative hemolysin
MEFLIIIGLILLNGIFAMAEMSLVSSRKFKLEAASKKGNKGAKTALELSEDPTKFLSTVQIGITLIGILLGIFSGENITTQLEVFLAKFEWIRPFAHNLAVFGTVISITYLSIVLGELMPKRIGLTFPETIVSILARPMKFLSVLTSPFVWLLTLTSNLLMRLLGIQKTMDSKVSEKEIKSIIKESSEGGEIQEIEQEIVERVFEMGDKKINALLTHHSQVVFFDECDDVAAILAKIKRERFSAYPVCRDNSLNNVLGIVTLKDLVLVLSDDDFKLKDHIRQPLFLTSNTLAYKALELFKSKKMHYAIVLDEYGSLKGVLTMDDVVDSLLGDTSDLHQSEYQIAQIDEKNWTVDGQFPISEFLKHFDLELDNDTLPEGFVTVGGLFISQNQSVPEVGNQITFHHLKLEVAAKDNNRIEKIKVSTDQ